MAEKSKKQKVKPAQKVVRYKPNINLLKHLNAIMLVAGIFAAFFTVFLLSDNDRYDSRSRGQTPQQVVTPSVSPSPSPSIAPTSLEN